MAGFFRGLKFVGNLFTPSATRAAFYDRVEESLCRSRVSETKNRSRSNLPSQVHQRGILPPILHSLLFAKNVTCP